MFFPNILKTIIILIMTRSKPYLGDLWSFCHGPWFLTLLVYIFVYLYRNDRLVFDKHIIFLNKCFFQYFPSSPVLFLSPFHCCRSALGTFITWFIFVQLCISCDMLTTISQVKTCGFCYHCNALFEKLWQTGIIVIYIIIFFLCSIYNWMVAVCFLFFIPFIFNLFKNACVSRAL